MVTFIFIEIFVITLTLIATATLLFARTIQPHKEDMWEEKPLIRDKG